MRNLKVKNRQKKALRNGKNKGGFNNQVTKEQMMMRVNQLLKNRAAEIWKSARDLYEVNGRGFVQIFLTDQRNSPHQNAQLSYVTEEKYKKILRQEPSAAADYNPMTEAIATYEPTRQAVVCIWYGGQFHVTKLTGNYGVSSIAARNKSLTIH